jgi:peptide/nickel transport system ATP-binding protein
MTAPALQVEDLSIAFGRGEARRTIVSNVSFSLYPGEVTALVGESGSGKTLLSKALIGLLPGGAAVTGGHISLDGERLDAAGFVKARRGRIAFIFQEPMTSLNPFMRIGAQMTDTMRALPARQRHDHVMEMLRKVRIHQPEKVLRRYPHQLSGGMAQRVMIATALAAKPSLVIADEPTTALDAIVQDEILELLQSNCRDMGAGVLLITHDLSTVANVAQTCHVLERGRIVESGSVKTVIRQPAHPYTRKLLAAIPPPRAPQPPTPSAAVPLIEARHITREISKGGWPRQKNATRILHDVSLAIDEGETTIIIGESGSGKTTLSRIFAGLDPASSGQMLYRGIRPGKHESAPPRRTAFIFQDSAGALNPTMRVDAIVGEGLLFDRTISRVERKQRVAAALEAVDLDPALGTRLPHQLSGGQRQRVNIARAIVLRPELIIADEPVSALDLIAQKTILDLFARLKAEMGFAFLIVSHDLGMVEHMADQVCVIYGGVLVEIGPRSAIFARPAHPYTRQLLSATTTLRAAPDGAFHLERRTVPPSTLQNTYQPHTGAHQQEPFRYIEIEPRHFVAHSL